MDKQGIVKKISDNIEQAAKLVEEALSLGKENGVPVHLDKVGITEDMWYVDPVEYREQYILENYGQYNSTTYEYDPVELTEEQLQEVNDQMKEIEETGGYHDDYKVVGWMSSSTNC